MGIRGQIIELGKELADQNDVAFNLWTWLPSHQAAKAAHGDYADTFTPSVADVMREASCFIADGLSPTAEQIVERGDLYKCPCGEPHDE